MLHAESYSESLGSAADAASRELREESGLNVEPSVLTSIARFAESAALLDFYVARVRSNARLTLQRSEVIAAEWVIADVVERRLAAGPMADPWTARLDILWPSSKRVLSVSPERIPDRDASELPLGNRTRITRHGLLACPVSVAGASNSIVFVHELAMKASESSVAVQPVGGKAG